MTDLCVGMSPSLVVLQQPLLGVEVEALKVSVKSTPIGRRDIYIHLC